MVREFLNFEQTFVFSRFVLLNHLEAMMIYVLNSSSRDFFLDIFSQSISFGLVMVLHISWEAFPERYFRSRG